MSYIESVGPARCKHCSNCEPDVRVPGTKRRQAYCHFHKEYIALRSLACSEFRLGQVKISQLNPSLNEADEAQQ